MMLKKFLGLALLAGVLAFALPARAADLALDGNLRGLCSTATASGGAATLNNKCGVITSESLTTAAGSPYTLTLTNSVVAAADIVVFSVANGTSTTGEPMGGRVSPAAGSVVFIIKNGSTALSNGGAAAFNGTIKVNYFVIKP